MSRTGNISVNSQNLFPIIKKWLYSDKDIFLRELVSNGCDAIKKLQHLQSMGSAPAEEFQPRIEVLVDSEAKTITISDNGLGMTEEEVEKYIAQVAFSGAAEFVEKYKEKGDGEPGIIGHFGLGFYSAFMVAESVEIDTLSYQDGATAVHWVSDGESTYEISEGQRQERGTTIVLHVSAEEADEFCNQNRLYEILHKYCAFMPYEIYLNPKTETRPVLDAEGNVEKDENGQDKMEQIEPQPINDTEPLWLKAPKDCSDEEYKAFYRSTFMDYNDPLFWIHLNVDYPFNLKGILYFPKSMNKVELVPGQVKLFSNRVFVADNIKEIIPEYLLLLKGVIDCPDMPLNVSRSFLQNDGEVAKISTHITKKVSDKLHQIFKNDRSAYETYWNDISVFMKFGCIRDEKFYDRIKDILLLKTLDGQYQTLEEYPKAQDGTIYYVTDEDQQSQYIKLFRDNGVSACILTHAIDSHFISMLEYMDHNLHFKRIDSEIDAALKGDNEENDGHSALVDCFKKLIQKDKLTVKVEKLKSTETPAVILLSEYTRRIQDMNKLYGEDFASLEPEITLVLNSDNPLIQKLPTLAEEQGQLIAQQIYDLAMLSHKSLSADELSAFIHRSLNLMEQLTQ